MYDDDIYSFLNSLGSGNTTTETEQQNTNQTTTFSPQTDYSPYNAVQDDPYTDDYSVTPNYESQQSYNGVNQSYGTVEEEQAKRQSYEVRQMETPMIRKEAPAVNLIKKRQKIELHARMKIAITMFTVILASLLFAIVYNFVSASKMRATFASKQAEIVSLQESIMVLKNEYTSLSSDETVKDWATSEEQNYAEPSSENTVKVKVKKVYDEETVEDMPSNWFNDVCDFLSGIFS